MAVLVERPFALIEIAIAAKAKVEIKGPSFSFSIAPPTADHFELETAVAALTEKDHSLTHRTDRESGQIVIGGLDEVHLDTAIFALKRRFTVEFNIGTPQAAYRETLTKRVEKDYTHGKKTGGTCQFARVKTRTRPARNLPSNQRSSAERSRRHSLPASRRASTRSWDPAFSPASRGRRQGDPDRRCLS